jgi:AcrR family transcriptional regulator
VPKVVDARQRREAVADAVLEVVLDAGLEAVTLRNVADRAGLAIGSVRHYFDGHQELIIFAVRELDRRITERLRAHGDQIMESLATAGGRAERRRLAEELLAEFLPLDEARRREAVLRHTFLAAARTRPALRPHATALRATMAAVVRLLLEGATAAGGVPADLDLDLEQQRLGALLDGLSGQAALSGEPDPAQQRAVLRHHLATLTTDRAE